MTKDVNVNGFSVLLFRIALSCIFILAGISHLVQPDKVATHINTATFKEFAIFFGDARLLGLLSGYVLLVFGVAFMLGIYTRYSALVLATILIPITITVQLGNGFLHGPLWKNVALFGGLLFFIINNPHNYNIINAIKFSKS
ncbi:DoxX family protein [Flavobacterium salilacus subsp. salilacus]|uniref:DoxX family protein n=1 Tax=Flavobacterium TaxID=237 RepID=UPI001074CAB2|nr:MULTISPECIES: DoxX family protein [Flavobacterium]KAF2519137.1 DoxX family protein [Flavobacterium salilacus subsp. salilacus]MBE1613316.1 DoxX family protein [Flavobacterium sp. SaA2.13]